MLKRIYTDNYYASMHEDDFSGKQRYILFVFLSIIGGICGILFFIQNSIIFNHYSWISYSMPTLTVAIAANFYLFKRHKNTKLAFEIIVLSCFIVLHLTTYKLGGIFSSSNFYLSVLTIATFILLGNKAGWGFIGLSSLHMLVMYHFTMNTNVIKHIMGNMHGAIEMDIVISMILSLIVIGLHCLSIEQTNKNLMREMNDSQKEIKNYTKSVEKTNKELDNFAYIVSHDLKAPLRAISSLSDWIQEDLGDNINEDAAENFKLLKSRVSRMELLINGILEYSRAGRANTPIVDVNINQLINDVIFLLDPPSHIKITTLGFMPVVQADKVKLQQVFSNILGNAIKYNDKAQGEISISCQQMLNSWKFVISDNGPGIEEQYRTKVFDIFQTLHSKDKMESTGVGLAFVKKIIEECEGEIYITSSEYGGASFVFSIPKEPVNLTGASTFNLKTA